MEVCDMAFQEDVVKDAWELVEGRCECSRALHQHAEGRCNKKLEWEKKDNIGWGAWEAHPVDGNPAHCGLTNCEILCWDCKNRI
jgi:hypothetical protein